MKEQDAAHPDFPQWIKTKDGLECMMWPITDEKYLYNRLSWAFDAGRNCVWDQYTEQKAELTRLRSELQQAKQEIANHIAVNSLLTDSDGESDLANKLYKATSELKQERELRKELINACEGVIRLRKLFEFTEDVDGTAHEGEAIAINRMIFVIETALEKSKAK